MKRFGAVLVVPILLGWFQVVNADVAFQDWTETEATRYGEELKNQNAALSTEDIMRVEQRLKKAKANNDWAAVATEDSHLVGKFPDRIENWLELSLALQKKYQDQKDYKTYQAAQFSALNAYRLAKQQNDKDKQAIALLTYGNTLSPDVQYESPSYLEILQEIGALGELKDLRKRFPDYALLMPFTFLTTRINNQTSTPGACFSFSHTLASKDVNYADFVTMTPNVDGDFTVNGRELCFSPLKYGENYDFTFKAGFASAWSEKTNADLKISFKVKDQSSRLSFTNKAYVLMRDTEALVPLTAVNVDSVKIKILYISDRGLNQIFTNSSDFLRTLWDYKVSEIGNNQGELLWEGEMVFGGTKNQTQTKQIPFSEVIKQVKPGIYVIQAEETGVLYGEKSFATQWLIVSDMVITTLSSEEGGLTVNVRSLKTAKPLVGVDVQLLAINNTILSKVKTSKEGLAVFDNTITRGKGGNQPRLVLVYGAKGDFSFMDLQQPAFDLSDRGVGGRSVSGLLDAYLYTEQGVYRPNDTVHLNTVLRDSLGVAKSELPLTFSVLRPDATEVGRYTVKGNRLGFYELTIPLSTAARTGQWTVLAYLDPKKPAIGEVHFSVEDFVPSRMLVSLKAAQPLLTPKNAIEVTAAGRYLFGVVANGIAGTATISLQEQTNPYPEYPGFLFGLATESFMPTRSDLIFSPLDKNGESTFSVALDKIPTTSKSLEAVVRVTLADTGGRPEIGTLTLPVRISPYMIGIKPLFDNGIVAEGESNAKFEIITINTEGRYQAVPDLEYDLFEEQLQYTWYQSETNSPWQYKTVIEDKFLNKGKVLTKDNGAVQLEVPIKGWAQYRLVLRDPKSGIQSSVRFTQGWMQATTNSDTPDKLTIKIDKENYKNGETVQLHIDSMFDGEALLTVANNKVLETRNISISKQGTNVKLNVNATWGTGVYCMISAFRPLNNPKEKSFLPKRAVGIAWIGMNTDDKRLDIELKTPAEIRSRQTINVPIQVTPKDKGNLSKNTQVTLAAVDEGILKLTDFKTPSPGNYFFDKHLLGIEVRDLYGKLIDPLSGSVGVLKVGGDGGALSRNMQALSKKSFKIVSLYSGLVALNANGKGNIKLNIPEFNGSLRLMAVAFDEKRLGNQENTILVRDPIVVEGVLPRFLAIDDQSELNLSLYNVKGEAGDYHLNLQAEGHVAIKGPTDLSIQLGKEATHHSAISIEGIGVGNGKIRIHLTGNNIDITNEFEISVRPSVAYLNKNSSQFIKSGESVQLTLDSLTDFVANTEATSITWSKQVPWNTQILLKNLAEYPYGCVEQTTSKGFGALQMDKEKAQFRVNQALASLSEKQNSNGSFQLWFDASGNTGDVWLTAYVVDFLQKAKEAHYDVPRFTLERGLDWLANFIVTHNNNENNFDGIAYGLYVLTKADKVETGSVRYFYDTYYEKLYSPFSRALIGAALAEKGDLERAKAAFSNVYTLNEALRIAPYGTLLRDRAGVLTMVGESLGKIPALQTISALVDTTTQALAEETQDLNRLSTQENVWLLLAAKQLHSANSVTPISVLLNNKPLTTTETVLQTELSSTEFQQAIEIKNQGSENLWQQVTISGLPAKRDAITEGVAIERHYYNLEGVELDPATVKQGTQMVVVLQINAKDASPHQWLMVDLLPAGFEIENARLGQGGSNKSMFPWLDDLANAQFIEPRDDRFVASIVSDGSISVLKLAYMVRAVTKGKYVHPGLMVEDMYSPKYYARTEETSTQIIAP